MADITLTTPSDQLILELPVDAPMRGVIDTESDFLGVVGEVGREVTESATDPVRWLLAHARTNGVIQLRLRGVPALERVPAVAVPRIVRAVSGGLAVVEVGPQRPDFFTDRALELSQNIAERSAELGAVRVTDGEVETPITSTGTGQHVTQLLGAAYADYGSVEGHLEAITVHNERSFNVYDHLTGRRIRCFFASRIPLETVTAALEKRVGVYGQINYRSSGEVGTVIAEALVVFPDDADLPTANDVQGILG